MNFNNTMFLQLTKWNRDKDKPLAYNSNRDRSVKLTQNSQSWRFYFHDTMTSKIQITDVQLYSKDLKSQTFQNYFADFKPQFSSQVSHRALDHFIPSPSAHGCMHTSIFMLSTYIFMYVALVEGDCSVNPPPVSPFCPHTRIHTHKHDSVELVNGFNTCSGCFHLSYD